MLVRFVTLGAFGTDAAKSLVQILFDTDFCSHWAPQLRSYPSKYWDESFLRFSTQDNHPNSSPYSSGTPIPQGEEGNALQKHTLT